MSEEDRLALSAARLYRDEKTFSQISEELKISKSHAQTMVRRGLDLVLNKLDENDPIERTQENPGGHQDGGDNPLNVDTPQLPFPQDPRAGSYELVTQGIGRRVLLTPADIMIFDLFKNGGFPGDLSQFISDSINFMYDHVRPAERK